MKLGQAKVIRRRYKARKPPFHWRDVLAMAHTIGGEGQKQAVRYLVIIELSHEKNPPTFRYTGWLIGILIYSGLL